MFTGFPSENTPAIQVWDFATTNRPFGHQLVSISLTDDCAPIQVIIGGESSNAIDLFLPSSPIEGKQIKLVNTFYGNVATQINIRSSDASGNGSSTTVAQLNAGQTLDLCYSKNFISRSSFANTKTGWISLNQAPISASNLHAVSFGQGNIASGARSASVGGASNTTSGQGSFIAGGSNNTASGQNSFVTGTVNQASNGGASVLGGFNNTASGSSSAIIGGESATTRAIITYRAFGSAQNVLGSPIGAVQAGLLIIGRQTTDATSAVLTSGTSAASTTNQVILPNNSAYYVKGSIIATVTGGGNTKSWDFIATIKRGANAAATSIVGAVTLNVQAADAGAATWVVAITADTTNGGLAVTVTGQAATTIRWVAKLESTEVTF